MRFVGLRLAVALVAATAMLTIAVGIAGATQITVQINNTIDDYKESQSGSSTKTDTTWDLWTTGDLQVALRFVAVAIPPKATITSAILKVYSPATGISNSLSGVARGEAVGNAPAWTGDDYEITLAPKTSALVPISNLPTWTANTHNQIANVTSIVQEIVNRCDWESGNALKVFLIASSIASHRRSLTYDSDPTRGAKLIVDYTPATATCNGRTIEIATRDETVQSIDLGWVGTGHNGTAIARGATLSATLGSCEHTSPPCGACQLSGPVPNICAGKTQIDSHRCSNNTRTTCAANADCGGGNTCDYYFGSYISTPLANFCVANKVGGALTGAVDLDDGDVAVDLPLTTSYTLFTLCPTCDGDVQANDGVRNGVCHGGPNDNLSCDVSGGGNPHLGATSLDCPPAAGFPTSNTLAAETNVLQRYVSANSPNCNGSPGKKCMCSTCNNAIGQPCFEHGDCPDNPPGTPGVCGGRRCFAGSNAGAPCNTNSQCPLSTCTVPGVATQPNACFDDPTDPFDGCGFVGIPTGGVETVCLAGPVDTSCSTASYAGCLNDSECSAFRTCSNDSFRVCGSNADCVSPGTCVTDICVTRARPCFETNGAIGDHVSVRGSHGTPVNDQWRGTLANPLVCVAPTTLSVDQSGLPGLSRVEIPVNFRVRP